MSKCRRVQRYLLSAAALCSSLAWGAEQDAVLTGAWVRALPPTQTSTAAYVTIRNKGASTLTINSASAAPAGRVEFHTSTMVDGLMRMQQLPMLTIAAGELLELSPGGAHLMLLDLSRMPVAGEVLKLCLSTAAQQQLCVDAPVRRSEQDNEQTNEHHHHH